MLRQKFISKCLAWMLASFFKVSAWAKQMRYLSGPKCSTELWNIHPPPPNNTSLCKQCSMPGHVFENKCQYLKIHGKILGGLVTCSNIHILLHGAWVLKREGVLGTGSGDVLCGACADSVPEPPVLWILVESDSYIVLRIPMDSYVFLCTPMDPCVFLWIPVDSLYSYGLLWISIGFLLIIPMCHYGFLCIPIGILWIIIEFWWTPMDSYVCPWFPMSSYRAPVDGSYGFL